MPKKNFALIGAAGYIAPRHMRAIKETGNHLVAAMDTSDSVGILDSYHPNAQFFTEYERFDRHIDMLRRGDAKKKVDYVSICSPNYLHDSHSRFAMRSGADAICEKPLVLNPWNIDGLQELELATGCRTYTILQLRLHPAIKQLKSRVASNNSERKFDVDLTYVTSRGGWYLNSWKGDPQKSGGIATNIGVHFFDMLFFVFGKLQDCKVHLSEATRAAGFLEYERARVRWYLSIDSSDLPHSAASEGKRTYRSINVDNREIEFSGGFEDLHTESYRQILAGNGFALSENATAIQTVSQIRDLPTIPLSGDYHPLAAK
jgi:UDP-N-acetyl-2-amino-2-deoxyglucuronate dehydrogenase